MPVLHSNVHQTRQEKVSHKALPAAGWAGRPCAAAVVLVLWDCWLITGAAARVDLPRSRQRACLVGLDRHRKKRKISFERSNKS